MAGDVKRPRNAEDAGRRWSSNRRFINQMLLKEKEQQSKNIHEVEEQQKLKLKLARSTLCGSSDQPLSHRSTLLAVGHDADCANSASDCEASPSRGSPRSPAAGRSSPGPCPGSSASSLDSCDSHSRIPKLPPLSADVADTPPPDGTAAATAFRGVPQRSNCELSHGATTVYGTSSGNGGGSGGSSGGRKSRPGAPYAASLRASQQTSAVSPSRRPRSRARPASEGDPAAATRASAAAVTSLSPPPPPLGPHKPNGGAVTQATAAPAAGRSPSKVYSTYGLPATPSGYAQWRARMRVGEGQRVFCIAGSGAHSGGIRAGLLARGWFENPDHNSPFFDFKWAANPLDISHDSLWGGQVVNHFRHSTCLTTKHGLCHTVRDLAWYEAADAAAFYPRAYDISDEDSRREFLHDVRWTAAECLIKRALLDGAVASSHTPPPPHSRDATGRRAAGAGVSGHQRTQPQPQSQAPQPQAGSSSRQQPQCTQQLQQAQDHLQREEAPASTGASVAAGCPDGTASEHGEASLAGRGGDTAMAAEDAGADVGASEAPPLPLAATVGDAAAGTEGGGDGSDDAGQSQQQGEPHRLQQRTDTTPLVDLPSLRLACRAVAARLRHHRHLRAAREGVGGPAGAGGSNTGAGGPVSVQSQPHSQSHADDGDLTTAQWQQLVRHRALSCSVPLLPPPQFDPAWLTDRVFITSALLPHVPSARRGKGSKARRGGGGGGRRRRRQHGGGAATGRAAPTDDERVLGRSDDGSDADSDGDADSSKASSAPASRAASDTEACDVSGASAACSDPGGAVGLPLSGRKGAAAAAAADGGGGGGSGGFRRKRVPVADAAELLRAAYGQPVRRRRHSAPAAQPSAARLDAGADAPTAPDAAAAAAATAADSVTPPVGAAEAAAATAGNGGADADGLAGAGPHGDEGAVAAAAATAADGAGAPAGSSWLPRALPSICYDDEALQALDHSNWRPAAEAILAALQDCAVQTHISGVANIWIAKPAGKSRGRGIRLFNDPDALLSYVRCEEAQGLESRWIAQKYVERPLIIQRRKFDIRQWVLVTSWNPLQAWFYSTCYLRFAADDYDPNNLDVFQHLTNNSVSKYFEGPRKEDEITASGNMWSVPRFQVWLEENYGRGDIWQRLLQPAMKHIVVCTLKAAQDLVTPRRCSCQLYGYDFLIDDQLRVWLLEVNASPTLEASTPITAQLCAELQEDILKVVVDMPEQRAAAPASGGAAGSTRRGGGSGSGGGGAATSAATAGGGAAASADAGRWECIIDGGEELRRPDYTGLNLEVKGTAIPIPAPLSRPSGLTQAPPPGFVSRLHAAIRQPRLSQLQQQQAQAQAQQQQAQQQQGQSQLAQSQQPEQEAEEQAVHGGGAQGQAPPPSPPSRNSNLRASGPLGHAATAGGAIGGGEGWSPVFREAQEPPSGHPPRSAHTPFGSYMIIRAGSGGDGEARVGSSGLSPSAAAAVQVYAGNGGGSGSGGSPRARARMSPPRLRTARLSTGPGGGGGGSSAAFAAPSAGLGASWDGNGGGNRYYSAPLGPPPGATAAAAAAAAGGWQALVPGPPSLAPLSAVATRASLFTRPGQGLGPGQTGTPAGGAAGSARAR